MKELSIIIPHYNSSGTLDRLLSSIPKKNELEIIVIDDKSDKGVDELNALKQKHDHVIYLYNNTNIKSAGTCRNIGLEIAKGKWILFADADDIFLEGFYDIVSSHFQSTSDIIFFTITSIFNDTGITSNYHISVNKRLHNIIEKRDFEAVTKLKYQSAVPWSKLIKNSFIKKHKILFDEVLASNDVMFSAKVGYFMKKFEVSPQVIYCFTESRGTLTKNTSLEVYDARLNVYMDYCQFLKKRLSARELELLDFQGRSLIFKTFLYRLGLKKTISVYRILKQNNIKIFEPWLFNPLAVIRKLITNLKKYRAKSKYLINK